MDDIKCRCVTEAKDGTTQFLNVDKRICGDEELLEGVVGWPIEDEVS